MNNRSFFCKMFSNLLFWKDYLPSGWGGRAHDEVIWPVVRKKVVAVIFLFLLSFLLLFAVWLVE